MPRDRAPFLEIAWRIFWGIPFFLLLFIAAFILAVLWGLTIKDTKRAKALFVDIVNITGVG